MNEDEEFWKIATNSGVVDPEIGLSVQDILNIIQTFTEASSWLSHTLSVSIDGQSAIPGYLGNVLVSANESAREIIAVLSKCNCKGCRELYGDK